MHLREHEVGVALPSRTAPIAIPESASSTIPIIAHHTPANSPQKSSPSESVLQENQLVSFKYDFYMRDKCSTQCI